MADMQVTYIDHMGDDLSVVNAARVSFDKESDWIQRPYAPRDDDEDDDEVQVLLTEEVPSQYEAYEGYARAYDNDGRELSGFMLSNADAKLIAYLARENHKSPFNHTFLSFRVKAPIIVARQLVKHEYMPWNEVSRRYVKTLPEFYHPPVFRKAVDNVKQGSSDDPADMSYFDASKTCPHRVCELALETYEELLRIGVCPEQARMYLPQNMMTEWIWSGTLFAFAKMLNLRLDKHTQYESRLVANLIEPHVARLFPVSWEALRNDTN